MILEKAAYVFHFTANVYVLKKCKKPIPCETWRTEVEGEQVRKSQKLLTMMYNLRNKNPATTPSLSYFIFDLMPFPILRLTCCPILCKPCTQLASPSIYSWVFSYLPHINLVFWRFVGYGNRTLGKNGLNKQYSYFICTLCLHYKTLILNFHLEIPKELHGFFSYVCFIS